MATPLQPLEQDTALATLGRSRSRSRARDESPPPQPTTPLRPPSRSSLRQSHGHSHGHGHANVASSSSSNNAYSNPLASLEPAFAELSDGMADLEANFMHLQLMHESLARFSECFASFLYGLNINAFCVDFPEAPVAESFKRALENPAFTQPPSQHQQEIDTDQTFMTSDTSFVENPPVSQPAPTASSATPSARGARGATSRGTRGAAGRGASSRGNATGTSSRGAPTASSSRGRASGLPRGTSSRGRAGGYS